MDSPEASTAAAALSRQRWGTRKTARLVEELLERVDEVDAVQAARLRAALDTRTADDGEGA